MALQQTQARNRFILLAGLVLTACLAIKQSALATRHPDMLMLGITGDLLITIPVLFYVCLVRPGLVRPASLIPVLLVCIKIAQWLLPVSGRSLAPLLLILSSGVEVASLTLLIRAIHAYRKRMAVSGRSETMAGDPFARFRRHASGAFPNHPILPFVLAELGVLYYGVLGWRQRPVVPEGTKAFTCYRKSGWKGLVGVLAFLILIEGGVLHVLLVRVNPALAWCATALDAWTILWLIGDYQAMRLRPLLLSSDRLSIRLGLRWQSEVERANVARIVPVSPTRVPGKRADYVKIAPVGDPDIMLVLKRPVEFVGPLGMRRQARFIGIQSDDPALLGELEAWAASAESASRARQ